MSVFGPIYMTFYPQHVPERTALYRRWRPQRFGEVVGQQHVIRTLRNAIASGQVAHAYLLAGPRGIGKTSIARLIAKAVNCPKAADGEPCDTCPACVSIRDGRFLDLIEIDAASNRGIDEMRDLREKVRFAPSEGQYKVYVVDEAHQLTSEAFNALLKTLEEPPPHVIFVLATTESQKIPATIVSRTQRFDLRRIPHKEMTAHLEKIAASEKMRVDPKALEAIARHAQGSLRDAESILDQLSSFSSDGSVSLTDVSDLLGTADWEEIASLFDALSTGDGTGAVALVGTLVDEGRDLHLFTRRAIEHVRALVLVRSTGKPPETISEAAAARVREQATHFTHDRLARVAKRLVEAEQQLRTGEGTPLPLELAVLELTAGGPAEPQPTVPGPQPTTRAAAPATQRRAPAPPPSRPRAVIDIATRRAPATEQAAPAVGAASPAVDLVQVREAWSSVVELTRARSISKASQLLTAEPLAIDGMTVVLGFADDFARSFWQDRERPELERDLSSALGTAVRVKCVRQTAPETAVPATEDPMLRAALETFRRPERILEVE
jgi:DNA polymerase III subunit gamma/tau